MSNKLIKKDFLEIISDITSHFNKIKKGDYLIFGKYPIIDQGKEFIAGYTNDESLITDIEKPVIIFGDHTRVFKYIDFPIAIGADGVKVLKVKNDINCNYIYYYLKSVKIHDAGYSRHFKFLKDLKIPVPDKQQDQIRIANILSRAEALIGKRKESIQLLDELLKSTFLDIFGDPVRNEKGWDIGTIHDFVDTINYGTSKSAQGGKYPYLRMNNITYEGYWDFSNLKYIDIEDNEKDKYLLKKGDIVFNRTNSKELVGKTAVYNLDREMIIAGYLIRIRLKEGYNPWYIWGYLNSKYGKLRLFNLCRNIVGMANINAKEIQKIPILIPPENLQNQFAQIVEKAENIKTKYRESLQELEKLYASLSQKAFSPAGNLLKAGKGELDLSKMEIEDQKLDVAAEEGVGYGNKESLKN